jgi:hypothetical protein
VNIQFFSRRANHLVLDAHSVCPPKRAGWMSETTFIVHLPYRLSTQKMNVDMFSQLLALRIDWEQFQFGSRERIIRYRQLLINSI